MSDIYLTAAKAVFSVADIKRADRMEARKKTKQFIYLIIIIILVVAFILFWFLRSGQSTKTKSTVTVETKNKAVALFNKGDFKKAIPKLKVYVNEHPGDIKARSILAQSYWLDGNNKVALNQYLMIIKIKPDDADTYYRLGILYGSLKENKRSISSLKEAVRINPKLAVFQAELAKAYARSGKYDQAINGWRRALDLTPESNSSYRAGIYAEIGNLYLLKNDSGNAGSAYEEGLKIDGNNEYLKSQLNKVK